MLDTPETPPAAAASALPEGVDLAALVAGKLCHDFISPAGAIASGLDLLDDPSAADMRDDALALISQSSRKMVALVHFARVAFGASTTSESFRTDSLRDLVAGLNEGGRAELRWRIDDQTVDKSAARTLVNLAWLTLAALPTGGVATVTARSENGRLVLAGLAEGPRARLKPEAVAGFKGQALTEGLQGQWIQPYWLWLTAREAGGRLAATVEDGLVTILADLPQQG
ncbi:histidine phosphotransferase [Brevundimonas sp. S30B]|uniref:histidine phosphotransferase ChpT n=1 Tax=unclassified Brevundimonas TaxID=2622653 RepID=UPI0010729205|nr:MULTISPECIES: histidine phosphotransferase family protein [unclassified Brevundimonas]QBX38509.1 histidine phosphotransferase [Brevundimonas sp. MF30-B]TFW02217.1 histidine phosphotransferase [Brevundimonas sp. S30B]